MMKKVIFLTIVVCLGTVCIVGENTILNEQKTEAEEDEDVIEISSNKEEREVQKFSQLDKHSERVRNELFDKHHGIKMGIPWWECDDGHYRIERDWDGNEYDYTCTDSNNKTIEPYLPNKTVPAYALWYRPPEEMSDHWCLSNKIVYNSPFPLFGPHRPLWAKFGRYDYVPPQRWLHNLEHGAIVFLYNPCTKKDLVEAVANVITSCMRRYVIAADRKINKKRPIMLLAWGARYMASDFNENEVVLFIRRYAMRGPESGTEKDGFYEFHLKNHSKYPVNGSDIDESNLCPTHPQTWWWW